jgi:hypothetical protein
MSEPTIPTIGLDFCEALELAEICELRFELRDTLASWAQLLVTRKFTP